MIIKTKQWVFIALIAILWVNYLESRAIAVMLFLIFFIIRFVVMNKQSIPVIIAILITMTILYSYWNNQYSRHSNFDLDRSKIFWLSTDPNLVYETEYGLKGTGKVNVNDEWIPVQFDLKMVPDKRLQRLKRESLLIKVSGLANRIEPARNFYQFDYKQFNKLNHIAWTIDIETIDIVQLQHNIFAYLQNYRAAILSRYKSFDKYWWGSIHNVVILNLSSLKFKQIKRSLSNLGIMHLFAISGFHIHILITYSDWLLRRCTLRIDRIPKVMIAILLLYGWLIGWPIGAVRAISYYVLKICRSIYHWNMTGIDLLAIIALSISIIAPFEVCKIGFIFSFMMTLLIKLCIPLLENTRWQGIKMNALCLIFTWPITMQMSYEWNVCQLCALILISAGFSYFIMPMLLLTNLLILITPSLVNNILQMIEPLFRIRFGEALLKGYESLTLVVGHHNNVWMCFLYLAAIYCVYTSFLKQRRGIVVLVMVYGALLIRPYLPHLMDTALIVDVGQGDALIYQPAGTYHNWLVDTGGRIQFDDGQTVVDLEYAEKNIIPTLKAEGVREIEGIIITHGDVDHMGNLFEICQHFKVKQIILNQETLECAYFKTVHKNLNRQIKIMVMQPTTQQPVFLEKGKMTLMMVAPRSTDDKNEGSIVVKMQIGKYELLNMGDLSKEGETRLVKSFPKLSADILKVSHHGSEHSTSDQFIMSINPKQALISAGSKNRYGHPHQRVLDTLNNHHIPFISTKEDGAIRISQQIGGYYKIDTQIKE